MYVQPKLGLSGTYSTQMFKNCPNQTTRLRRLVVVYNRDRVKVQYFKFKILPPRTESYQNGTSNKIYSR